MRRRLPPEPVVERPACCPYNVRTEAMWITISTVAELPDLLRQACPHVLDEVDRRQQYWDDMRAESRRNDPLPPIRQAINAERRRRATLGVS